MKRNQFRAKQIKLLEYILYSEPGEPSIEPPEPEAPRPRPLSRRARRYWRRARRAKMAHIRQAHRLAQRLATAETAAGHPAYAYGPMREARLGIVAALASRQSDRIVAAIDHGRMVIRYFRQEDTR